MCDRLECRSWMPLPVCSTGPGLADAFLDALVHGPAVVRARGDDAPLTVVAAIVRRACGWCPRRRPGAGVGRGDVAIMRGPDPFTFADEDPATPTQVIIQPGQRCTTPDGEELVRRDDARCARVGQHPGRHDVDARRHLPPRGEVGARLLGALPTVLVVPHDAWASPLLPLLAAEMVQGLAGSGRRARPSARPAPDRGPARLVRAPGGRRRPAWYRATPTPSSAPPYGCCEQQPGASVDGRQLAESAGVSGRRSPVASPTWSASRR